MDIADIVYGNLILVTGKGGVGKTQIAAAIGTLAAAQGRKTALVEMGDQTPSMNRIFSANIGYEPSKVADNLWALNVDWASALQEWIQRVVPIKRVVKLILENALVRRFLDATPGNREVVVLSKLVWLCQQYDLVVVDLPASGHAASLMAAPHRMLELFRNGPIADRGREALKLLGDPGTNLVLVAMPEEMVINETIETWQKIRESTPSLKMPLVVLNRAMRPTLTDDERELLSRLEGVEGGADTAEMLKAARWEARQEASTAVAMSRLTSETEMNLVEIPALSAKEGSAPLVRNVAAALARSSNLRSKGIK